MGTRFHAPVFFVGLVFLGAAGVFGAVDNDAVVVVSEDVCVVGRDEVEARYCAHLSLPDIGTDEGFLRHLHWLRLDNSPALLQVQPFAYLCTPPLCV